MAAKPKKPLVPSEADARIADLLWNGMSRVDGTVAEASRDTASAVERLREIGEVVEQIRTDQPRLLEPYGKDLIATVQATLPLSDDDAAMLVLHLFASTTMARIIADAANGNIDPLATTRRARPAVKKATAKKTAPKTAASDPDGATAAVAVEDRPEAKPAKRAAAAPQPVAPDPVVDDSFEPDMPATVLDDFAEPPEVEPVAPEPVPVGVAVGEDDF